MQTRNVLSILFYTSAIVATHKKCSNAITECVQLEDTIVYMHKKQTQLQKNNNRKSKKSS